MKHLALTVAFMACSLPSMAGHYMGMDMDDFAGIFAIAMVFGLPVFIVALLLYFGYKNKQAKYRLASEALAAGKEIPQELFKGNGNAQAKNEDTLKKGIKNVFLGIGLGVFLWVLTYEEGIAAIGFLIFCIGAGQVVTAYATRPKETNTSTDIEKS